MTRGARLEKRDVSGLRRSLLSWYDRNRRDLPWRKSRDPYRVWISEIMLQQTRVAAVLPRYEKFLGRFPSVGALASAKEASVLTEWSGLGYYRRARNLHRAAQTIARERGGQLPRAAKDWRTLPGVGQYTAAAIASIAFGEPVAVRDGNVDRVLGRLLGDALAGQAAWSVAQELLDPKRPGDFNQAMMELGATICLPGQPVCRECPVRKLCRTRGRGEPKPGKSRQRKRRMARSLAMQQSAVFLVRRSFKESLMPGMWELPEIDLALQSGETLFTVRHSITNTDYMVTVLAQSPAQAKDGSWVRVSRLNSLPLTGLTRKILCKAKIIQ